MFNEILTLPALAKYDTPRRPPPVLPRTSRAFEYRCVCDQERVYRRGEPMRVFLGTRDERPPFDWGPIPLGYWQVLARSIADAAIERDRGRLILVCNELVEHKVDGPPKCGCILYFEHVEQKGADIQGPYSHVWKQTWNMTRFLEWKTPTYR